MMNIYTGSSTVDIHERAVHKTRVVDRQTVAILTKRRNSLAPLPSNPEIHKTKSVQKTSLDVPQPNPAHQIPSWRQRALLVEALLDLIERYESTAACSAFNFRTATRQLGAKLVGRL
jgi:hypothetical protein